MSTTDLPASAAIDQNGVLSFIPLPNASQEQRQSVADAHPGGVWAATAPDVFERVGGGWTVTNRGPLGWCSIQAD